MSALSRFIVVSCTGLLLASGCGEVGSDEGWTAGPTLPNVGPGLTPDYFGAEGEATPGDACEDPGSAAYCGDNHVTFCDVMSDEDDLQWGPCMLAPSVQCRPGDAAEVCTNGGWVECTLWGGVPGADGTCNDGFGEEVTPLVLRFDESPIEFAPVSSTGFEMGKHGCDNFDWPAATTPWLVLDRNGDGFIQDGSELFGSATRLGDGRLASNGFEALRELDSNGDGVISELDARWFELATWADDDGDRLGTGLELAPITESGLLRIELDYRVDRLCDARGNCEIEKAEFVYADGRGGKLHGEVVDVHMACQ